MGSVQAQTASGGVLSQGVHEKARGVARAWGWGNCQLVLIAEPMQSGTKDAFGMSAGQNHAGVGVLCHPIAAIIGDNQSSIHVLVFLVLVFGLTGLKANSMP